MTRPREFCRLPSRRMLMPMPSSAASPGSRCSSVWSRRARLNVPVALLSGSRAILRRWREPDGARCYGIGDQHAPEKCLDGHRPELRVGRGKRTRAGRRLDPAEHARDGICARAGRRRRRSLRSFNCTGLRRSARMNPGIGDPEIADQGFAEPGTRVRVPRCARAPFPSPERRPSPVYHLFASDFSSVRIPFPASGS